MSAFREFLYLNERLVNEMLAQLEGGIYDEDEQKNSSTGSKSRGVEARVTAPIGGLGANTTGNSTDINESKRILRQTSESRFNRLYDALGDDLKKFDDACGGLWAEIAVRDLIEIDGYVDVPTAGRMLASSDQISGLFQMMKIIAPEQVPENASEVMAAIGQIGSMLDGNIVINIERREGDPIFMSKLDTQWLRIPHGDLEGEAAVMGRILRKWPEGQSYPLLAVPGLDLMSRRDRREAEKNKQSNGLSDELVVNGPGITLSVIAIYR